MYLVYKNQNLYRDRDEIINQFQIIHNYNNLEKYIAPSDKCNYYIDVCDIYEGSLRVWGWLYIYGLNSQTSKLKILLNGVKKQYIFGLSFRKRTDIQEKFGDANNNYLFSGVDFLMPINEIDAGSYEVSLLISNGNKLYKVEVNSNMKFI